MFALSSDRQTPPHCKLLEEACALNVPAEIHFERDEVLCAARMRLLELDDDELRTDSPQCIGKTVKLQPGEQLSVFFVLKEVPYSFETRVIRPITSADVNEEVSVIGMSLKVPDEVPVQQRRHDFRLTLAEYEVTATVHPADPEEKLACPINADRFTARVTDVSQGGLRLLVLDEDRARFDMWERMYVAFELPGDKEPYLFLVELKHRRRVHEKGYSLIGAQFLPVECANCRLATRRIVAFITAEQRRRIRKKK